MENTDNQLIEYDKLSLEELRALMNDRQHKFCEEYLIDLNATQAAIRSGYSKNTARSTGYENLTKPYIKEYIRRRLGDYDLTSAEILKMMSDIAKSSLNDFVKIKKVRSTKIVKVPAYEIINDNKIKILKISEYIARAKLTQKQISAKEAEILNLENEIVKIEIDLRFDPKLKLDKYVEHMIDDIDLDIIALAKDKERGRIKSFTNTPQGVKVETYTADDMLAMLAKIKSLVTNKIDVESTNKNYNMDVNVTDEEAAAIAAAILKDI